MLRAPIRWCVFFEQAIVAKCRAVGRLTVPLVSIADLVAMKRRAGRAQDLADVAHLELLLEPAP